WVQDLRLASKQARSSGATGTLQAPMHGRVTQVLVAAGQPVEAGALLLVMEAMKIEHRLHAPCRGVVQALHAKVGDQVAARQALAEVA
ncbi:MAG TPA: acetyl-CoA carboxylase biotin carboxyl carrier protein subunit, partial [Burkholderiaceae bacterium]